MLPTRGMVWLPEPETTEPGGIGVMAGQLLTGPRGMAFWESWQGKTALSYDIDDDVFSSDHEGSLWHKMPECRDIAAYLLSHLGPGDGLHRAAGRRGDASTTAT